MIDIRLISLPEACRIKIMNETVFIFVLAIDTNSKKHVSLICKVQFNNRFDVIYYLFVILGQKKVVLLAIG